MTDTEQLEWLVKNRALVHTGGEDSPDKFFWVIYRDGTSSDSRPTFRAAIDIAVFEMADNL